MKIMKTMTGFHVLEHNIVPYYIVYNLTIITVRHTTNMFIHFYKPKLKIIRTYAPYVLLYYKYI